MMMELGEPETAEAIATRLGSSAAAASRSPAPPAAAAAAVTVAVRPAFTHLSSIHPSSTDGGAVGTDGVHYHRRHRSDEDVDPAELASGVLRPAGGNRNGSNYLSKNSSSPPDPYPRRSHHVVQYDCAGRRLRLRGRRGDVADNVDVADDESGEAIEDDDESESSSSTSVSSSAAASSSWPPPVSVSGSVPRGVAAGTPLVAAAELMASQGMPPRGTSSCTDNLYSCRATRADSKQQHHHPSYDPSKMLHLRLRDVDGRLSANVAAAAGAMYLARGQQEEEEEEEEEEEGEKEGEEEEREQLPSSEVSTDLVSMSGPCIGFELSPQESEDSVDSPASPNTPIAMDHQQQQQVVVSRPRQLPQQHQKVLSPDPDPPSSVASSDSPTFSSSPSQRLFQQVLDTRSPRREGEGGGGGGGRVIVPISPSPTFSSSSGSASSSGGGSLGGGSSQISNSNSNAHSVVGVVGGGALALPGGDCGEMELEEEEDGGSSGSATNVARICRWDNCNKPFYSLGSLVAHLDREHTLSVFKYSCLWRDCPRNMKPFDARYKLVTHLRCHTGEKPYKCSVVQCSRSFSRLENLKLHIRTHTGEKPYTCHHDGCSKRFNNTSDRAKHMKTHITRKPYACKYPGCMKSYTDPSSMRKHIKFAHRLKEEEQGDSHSMRRGSSSSGHWRSTGSASSLADISALPSPRHLNVATSNGSGGGLVITYPSPIPGAAALRSPLVTATTASPVGVNPPPASPFVSLPFFQFPLQGPTAPVVGNSTANINASTTSVASQHSYQQQPVLMHNVSGSSSGSGSGSGSGTTTVQTPVSVPVPLPLLPPPPHAQHRQPPVLVLFSPPPRAAAGIHNGELQQQGQQQLYQLNQLNQLNQQNQKSKLAEPAEQANSNVSPMESNDEKKPHNSRVPKCLSTSKTNDVSAAQQGVNVCERPGQIHQAAPLPTENGANNSASGAGVAMSVVSCLSLSSATATSPSSFSFSSASPLILAPSGTHVWPQGSGGGAVSGSLPGMASLIMSPPSCIGGQHQQQLLPLEQWQLAGVASSMSVAPTTKQQQQCSNNVVHGANTGAGVGVAMGIGAAAASSVRLPLAALAGNLGSLVPTHIAPLLQPMAATAGVTAAAIQLQQTPSPLTPGQTTSAALSLVRNQVSPSSPSSNKPVAVLATSPPLFGIAPGSPIAHQHYVVPHHHVITPSPCTPPPSSSSSSPSPSPSHPHPHHPHHHLLHHTTTHHHHHQPIVLSLVPAQALPPQVSLVSHNSCGSNKPA